MIEQSGIVVEEQRNYYRVDSAGRTVRATLSGAVRKQRVRPCIGDRVDFVVINQDGAEGVIRAVRPRKNHMRKPPVANMDQALLVFTFHEPPLDLAGLDRFLCGAAAAGIQSVLVANKCDVLNRREQAQLDAIIAVYQTIGYAAVATSAQTGANIEALLSLCTARLSFFAGLSGVGKSSLLARIFPDHAFRTSELSHNASRGVHTTTNTRLLPLRGGGYIADTPGYSLVDLPAMAPESVRECFPEIMAHSRECRFHNCLHINEPDCAVKQATADGRIASWRYEHYAAMYDEHERRARKSGGKKRRGPLRSKNT